MSEKYLQPAARLENMYFSPIRAVMEKVAAIKEEGYPVVGFTAGEPDFDTPKTIKDATIRALEKNQTHYAPNRGVLSCRKEIASMLERVTGVSYDPNTEIIVTASGAEAINNAFLAVLNPGDEVIVFSPSFMNYENLICMCGAVMVDVPLKSENGFQIDADELEKHITPQTRMIVINNPCNPTGAVYSAKTLERVAQLAVEHDLLVFSDEIYNQILYGVECRSIASFPGMKERTIMMNGFSKAYAMTGWRIGIIAADARILPNILKVHQYTTTCVNTFAQVGLAESMNAPETLRDIDTMVQRFDERRKLLMSGLDQIGKLKYVEPTGAFYIFVDVSATGMDGDEFADRILKEKYVACIPGSKLGKECKNFIRMSYATSEDNIREGLKRIDEFVNHK